MNFMHRFFILRIEWSFKVLSFFSSLSMCSCYAPKFQLAHTSMEQWGVRRRVAFVKESNHQLASNITKEEEVEDSKHGVLRAVKSEPLELPEPKRKKLVDRRSKVHHGRRPLEREKLAGGRWRVERLRQAEKSLLDIMVAMDATFANPITRTQLRIAARGHIGDTGLIDHLLKYVDGSITPCGSKRFRRWFNHNGIMEYWLECAELADMRKEAGQHPYWIPAHSPSDLYDSSGELKLLKAEVDKMKSDMQELMVSRKQEKDQTNMLEDLVKCKSQIEESLKLTWEDMQDKLGQLMIWKASVEQQLVECTNVMSNMQAAKQDTITNRVASEQWEDWLESDVDNFQGNELVPWFENTVPANREEEAIIQYPQLAPDGPKTGDSSSQDPFYKVGEEMIGLERNIVLPRLEWGMQTEQANVTPNSSATASSKSDVDNLQLFQEMFQELFSWKSDMEQKMMELTNSVNALKQPSTLTPPAFQLPDDRNLRMDYYSCYKF